jgi:hypothetical protein
MESLSDLFRSGPDTLGGPYMRGFWHPVYNAEDLKPGWAKPIRIMSAPFFFPGSVTLTSCSGKQTMF